MLKIKILVFFVLVAVASCSWFEHPPLFDRKCGFTRKDALQCVLDHGDINHDGKLTKAELEHILDVLAPKAKWLVNIKRTMKDCDYNKDGVLSPRDWKLSNKTCMPKQRHLCTFKWFCDRAQPKLQ